jgi:MFS family permease
MKSSVIQMLSSLALSASLLFIPNLAKDLGANDTEIGVIAAVYYVSVFLSSFLFGRASDVYNRKFLLRLGLGISVFTFFLQILTDPLLFAFANPLLLAVARALVGFSLGMFPAALTAHVYESGNLLGRFSSFGALGWAVGTFVAGLISLYWGIFLLSSVCFLLAFLISFKMTEVNSPRLEVPFFPKKLLKKNWFVYLPFFLRHSGANCIWVIYPLYIASLQGDKFWIGVIYMVNTASQFVVMRFADRFRDKALIITGFLMSFITFLSFSVAQVFYHLLPMQVILGCSWSCIYVGSLLYLMKRNVEKATSTGILSSVISLAAVFGSLIGGVIAQFFGFTATMYTAAALTAVGFMLNRIGMRKTS